MIKTCVTGYGGKMGKIVVESVLENDDFSLVCVQSRSEVYPDSNVATYKNTVDIKDDIDVIIDFSNHGNLDDILEYATDKKVAVVLATTGYSDEELEKIRKASLSIPIFQSYNMAVGVNICLELVRTAAKLLDGFDIEIIEKHHNRKKDAPSGTAVMIANAVKEVIPQAKNIYGRYGNNAKREKNDVGIHAVRGGTIVGEHQTIFAGDDEVVTITHQSQSRKIFANGSLVAARYLLDQKAGLYNMDSMLNSI